MEGGISRQDASPLGGPDSTAQHRAPAPGSEANKPVRLQSARVVGLLCAFWLLGLPAAFNNVPLPPKGTRVPMRHITSVTETEILSTGLTAGVEVVTKENEELGGTG